MNNRAGSKRDNPAVQAAIKGIRSKLCAYFPALKWYVPQKRKIWMHEDRRMQYCDAARARMTGDNSNS